MKELEILRWYIVDSNNKDNGYNDDDVGEGDVNQH